LEYYARDAGLPEQALFSGNDDAIVKSRIIDRPPPDYSPRARQKGITGSIRVRMVLTANGNVDHVLLLNVLPEGLNEESIKAAHKVRFIPATKDGHPVSQAVTIDYTFNIY
ncbi:MAG: oligo,6-glucosidase, partial [Acidobacteriota bacterium]|jgi:TonB family protein|nr:oligo,6-glucosidase [Acidobacteriota bacterium]